MSTFASHITHIVAQLHAVSHIIYIKIAIHTLVHVHTLCIQIHNTLLSHVEIKNLLCLHLLIAT